MASSSRELEEGPLERPVFTREDLDRHLTQKIEEYETTKEDDEVLWAIFQEDFEDWYESHFKTAKKSLVIKLRQMLRQRGVFVQTVSRKAHMQKALADTAHEEERTQWADLDIINVCEEGCEILSRYLNFRYKVLKGTHPVATLPPTDTPVSPVIPPPQPVPPIHPIQPPPPHLEAPPQLHAPLQDQRTQFPTSYKFQHEATPEPRVERQTTPTGSNLGFGRELANMTKMYTPEMKYGSEGDNFGLKLIIFTDIANRVDLPEEGYHKALPIMLKGLALDYYYTDLIQLHGTFLQLCNAIQEHFEDANYKRGNLAEWNKLDLAYIKSQNPDKSTNYCFQLLVNKLRTLRHGLSADLHTEGFMLNKLVLACRDFPDCQITCSAPPDTLTGLISSMKASITAYEYAHKDQISTTETFMTDRQYHGSSNFRGNSRGNSYSRGFSQGRGNNHSQGRNSSNFRGKKRCFVCEKENCWSFNHTEAEQRQSKEIFKLKYSDRFQNRYGKPFEKSFRQYVTEYEGTEDDIINEAFQSIVIDSNDNEDDDNDETFDDIEESENVMTSLGQISSANAEQFMSTLNDEAFIHSISHFPSPAREIKAEVLTTSESKRYGPHRFFGIMIDTGASTKSTVGYDQYLAFNSIQTTSIITNKEKEKIKFGIGATSSIGSILVTSPIGTAEFHIVEADTPFLLCLADMDRLKVHFNNLKNLLFTPHGQISVIRQFGHPFLLWNESLHSFLQQSLQENECFLTETEIRRLHKRFGHPSVQRLQRVLERAGHDVDSDVLQHLTKFCKHCQKHGKSPGRFRFTLRDDVEFNYSIFVDIMYINNQPLLHIVDEGTRFQNGKWLRNISARHTWEKLQECWINTYLGPPDLIVHDAGKNFVSKEFKQHARAMGTTCKSVPVEAHNSIGIVERYHGPIRRAYEIISAELPELGKDMALQMAFKAVNDIAGPDGIVPTLLVFGAYPRMTEYDAPSPTISQRSATLKKAMDEVRKLRAKRQVNDALNHRNGPSTTSIKDLPLNSSVLAWRETPGNKTGKWTGPYPLIGINGEECTIELSSGPTNFRTTVVKPYFTESDKEEEAEPSAEPPVQQEPVQQLDEQTAVRRGRGRPRKHPLPQTHFADIEIFVGESTAKTQFEYSRQKEINGLIERGVFELINFSDIPSGVRVFNSRFVDEVKHEGTDKAFEKSRLVIQAYNDQDKSRVLTQSPTIQRVSQRIVLAMAAIFPENGLYLRDITQAYTQSTTKLNRDFYVRPPKNVSQWEGFYLKIVKPLYGVPEAGNHWFGTYHKHHMDKLRMTQSTYDPCLMFVNQDDYFGVVGLQTDDTLFLANQGFALAEETELKKAGFTAKERDQLTVDTPIKFNGGKVSLQTDGSILLTQEAYNKSLQLVENTNANLTGTRGTIRHNVSTKDQYVAQRARGAYLATVSQPEAAFDLSFAAQMINPGKEETKLLNKRIQWQIENSGRGLKFVKLDKNTLKLIVFTDSSFANNRDYTSQIGYVVILADQDNNANILHWSSTKCRRVTRSVLASELYAMSNSVDMAASIKATIELILNLTLPLTTCTDSKSLYDCLVKLGTTQEKRLMVDLMCLRQSYERREIAEIKWIDGDSNPADAMTKSKACPALRELIDTNKINIKVTQWVERNDESGDANWEGKTVG
jgi:hypothetical protein